MNDAIKPDVCEYGGNLVWDGGWPGGSRILNKDPETGIISLYWKHTEKLFTADIGTSYAAPQVAHLAARILAAYPNISANLVRALVANCASLPAAAFQLLPKLEERQRVYGYGQPAAEVALFSTANRVTLIAEDELALGSLHVYEVPIPDELREARGERRVTVTLAFDPPVRNTRKDYLGTKMTFRLLRGLTTERILRKYAKREAGIAAEEIPPSSDCPMSPLPTAREGGTLQKAVFTVRQDRSLRDYEGDLFHILVDCKLGWAAAEEIERQRYALAVTLEATQGLLELYNPIRQRIRLPQRVQLREPS